MTWASPSQPTDTIAHTHKRLSSLHHQQRKMDELFLARPGQGEGRGYLSVSRNDASVPFPVSSTYDGAEPSATSVAVSNLLRLAVLTACSGESTATAGKEEEDGLEIEDETFTQRAARLLALALLAPETPLEALQLLGEGLSMYGPGVMQIIIAGSIGRCGGAVCLRLPAVCDANKTTSRRSSPRSEHNPIDTRNA